MGLLFTSFLTESRLPGMGLAVIADKVPVPKDLHGFCGNTAGEQIRPIRAGEIASLVNGETDVGAIQTIHIA